MKGPAAIAALALFALVSGCIDVDEDPEFFGDPEPCIPFLEPDVGASQGQWSQPAAVGVAERAWQPSPLQWADAEHLARIESLSLALEWTNGPQGGADFGIALGRDGSFRYWNTEYQTTLGPQRESLDLSRAQLEEHGFASGDRLDAGPSVSTGAYAAASSIGYELSWTATFQQPPADEACDRSEAAGPGERGSASDSAAQATGRHA